MQPPFLRRRRAVDTSTPPPLQSRALSGGVPPACDAGVACVCARTRVRVREIKKVTTQIPTHPEIPQDKKRKKERINYRSFINCGRMSKTTKQSSSGSSETTVGLLFVT